jgi:CheY-like chemotaxis protein
MIRNLLARLGHRTVWRESVPEPALGAERKAILIVDADPDSWRDICASLSGAEYRVATADTPGTAARKLAQSLPDLILIDREFPAEDGAPLAHHWLADEELATIPMVALTETVTDPRAAHEPAGTYDGHICKPVDAVTFPEQVREFLQGPMEENAQPAGTGLLPLVARDRREGAARLLSAIETGLPDSQFDPRAREGLRSLAESAGAWRRANVASYLVRAERLSNAATARGRYRFRSVIRLCRELLEGGFDIAPGLPDLRSAYIDRRRTELISLRHALSNGDFTAIGTAGHNLKGTGAAYCFGEISDLGRAIETAAKDGNGAAIGMLLDRIDTYIGIVVP